MWAVSAVCAVLLALGPAPVKAQSELREDFASLERWRPLFFDNIDAHSSYSIEHNASSSWLRGVADNSASALVSTEHFNPYEFPHLSWRWKVSNVYQKGDATSKSGDDYPLRVYVLFEYDPSTASGWQKVKYGLAKAVYGDYPPDSTLNYIWANQPHDARVLINAYTDRARMIPLRQGTRDVGKWVDESVHIIEDYREAFGESPPANATLAVMSDADNTGERAIGFIDYLRLSP